MVNGRSGGKQRAKYCLSFFLIEHSVVGFVLLLCHYVTTWAGRMRQSLLTFLLKVVSTHSFGRTPKCGVFRLSSPKDLSGARLVYPKVQGVAFLLL